MLTSQTAGYLLVAATALHAGFQLVVTFLVYPAFAEVPADDWARHHAAHSRRITGLVAVVYGLALLAVAGVVVTGTWQVGTLTSVAATGLAMLVTMAVAAPAHGRLCRGRGERDLATLLAADRVRLGAAVLAAVAALAATVGAVP